MCVFIHTSPTQQSLYLILISDSYSKLSDIWPDWVLWNENRIHAMCDHFTNALINKCIGDDAKAAARQSPNCIKKTKINKIWRKTIFNMADGILTPYNVARSWHWFRQVTAPCNVARGFGIMTVNSPSGSRPNLQRDTWLWDDRSYHWIRQVATPCSVAGGCGMTCHGIRPNVRHIGILHLLPISTNHRTRHVILHQSPKFYPNRTTLGTSCRFLRWRTSAILDFWDPIMGYLKSPITTY